MRKKFTRKGQSTLEYAILVLIVIVALLAMQTYLKRGVQGRMRESSDSIGEAYSPAYTTSAMTLTSKSTTQSTVLNGVTKTDIKSSTDDRVGQENIPEYDGNEYWP